MATVTMSISEYDALKSELRFYQEILDVLTTPVVSEFSVNYYKDNPDYKIYLRADNTILSKPAQFILSEKIRMNLPEELQNIGNAVIGNNVSVDLGYIEHAAREEEIPQESKPEAE